MKKLIQNIYEYIKLILKEWYWILGLVPSFLGIVNLYIPYNYHFVIPSQYTFVYALVMFPIISYRIWNKANKNNKAPKIIIDYDLSSFNICYLYIKNIGNSYAKNIQTIFTPNIKVRKKNLINDSNFCKNLNQLAPSQSIRFFFGTFTEKNILQQFNVRITYFDLESGEKYISDQIIDPNTFIGTSSQENESKIVKELKEISVSFKKVADNVSEIPKAIKSGLNIRNMNLKNLSEKELKNILYNMCLYGAGEDFWLNPFMNDTGQIIKYLRDKMLTREDLTIEDGEFLRKLNVVYSYQPYSGDGNKFKESVRKLFEK